MLEYAVLVLGRGGILLCDIAGLFVVVRLICRWRPIGFLTPYDAIGRPIVDGLRAKIAEWWSKLAGHSPLTERRELGLILVALLMARLLLATALSIVG